MQIYRGSAAMPASSLSETFISDEILTTFGLRQLLIMEVLDISTNMTLYVQQIKSKYENNKLAV